jgi:hypothetical protein
MRIAARATVHSERTRQSRRGARDTWPVDCNPFCEVASSGDACDRFWSDHAQLGSWKLFAFFRTPQLMRLQTRLATRSSADRSRCAPYGGVLLACQGKFPINELQKSGQLAVLLLKHLDPEP